jgi:hypothetical protein
MHAAAISHDGMTLATVGMNFGQFELWSMVDGSFEQGLGMGHRVDAAAFMPDDRKIAAIAEGQAELIDVQSGAIQLLPAYVNNSASLIAVSPDGRRVGVPDATDNINLLCVSDAKSP